MPAITGVEILRELGRGGMGVVYVGRQPALERDVAVKVLDVTYSTAESRERFVREAKSAASLTHPGIVTIHDTGVSRNGIPYILMTLLPGGSLRGRLDAGQPLPPEEVARIGIQVADALAHAHAHDVIHRDVKPSNILLDGSGNAYLADFGIAQLMGATRLTSNQVQLGTTEYMAPELATGKPSGPASDVYALGVTLYEALAGHPPYVGEDPQLVLYQHRFEELPPLPAEVPEPLAAVVTRALLKDPEARWASAGEMAAALRDCLGAISGELLAPAAGAGAIGGRGGLTVAVRRRPHVKPARRVPAEPRNRRRIGLFALGAAALLLVALVATLAVLNIGRLTAPGSTSYAFSSETYASGLEVHRTWVLTPGKPAVLAVRLDITNTTDHAVTGTVDETITKELAASAADVRFDPQPAAVLQRDPVVRFGVTDLAAGKTTTVRYQVTLRNGVPSGGIAALADRERRAQATWLNCPLPVAAHKQLDSGSPAPVLWIAALLAAIALWLLSAVAIRVALRLVVRIALRAPGLVALALVVTLVVQFAAVTTARADSYGWNTTYYGNLSISFASNPAPNGVTTEYVSYLAKGCFSTTVAAYDMTNGDSLLWKFGPNTDCSGAARSFSETVRVSCCGATHHVHTYILAQNAIAGPNLYNGFIGQDLGTCGTASPPQNVSANAGVGSASVSWSPPAAYGCGLSSYGVSAPGAGSQTVGGTSASFSGLANGSAYTFTVVANNAAGASGPATANAVTTPNVPGPPSGVSASPGINEASVSWGPPGSDGGSGVTGYVVTGEPGGLRQSAGAGTFSATFSGLSSGTGYTFTVVAVNAVGTGPGANAAATPSAPLTPTPPPQQTPPPGGGGSTPAPPTPVPPGTPTPEPPAPLGTPTPSAVPSPTPTPTCAR